MQDTEHVTVERIMSLRDRLLLSNADLARLTEAIDPSGRGVTYQTLRRLESGENDPRPRTLRLIWAALLEFERNPT